ncbi:hypothetical protein BH23THE1_BH23THE1_35030 [soil metagenome]
MDFVVVVDVVEAFTFELAAAASLTSAANCPEFCSNVLAVFTPMFEMCLETSFVCCSMASMHQGLRK